MEPITLNCVRHQALNELYCIVCNSYLCGECVTDHGKDSHRPRYLHVMQYSPERVLPKIDKLIEVQTAGTGAEADAKLLKEGLDDLVPKLQMLTETHTKTLGFLKTMLVQVAQLSVRSHKPEEKYADSVRQGLNYDKLSLQRALSTRNTEGAARLAQKIDIEAQLDSGKINATALIKQLEQEVERMERSDPLKSAVAAASAVATKCRMLRMAQYTAGWTCDRRYLSTKMFLSEDGLTFGNTATNGYPGIIGDVPFENGLYAFEVTPISLDCAGKEGFGIIERDKYIATHTADPTTPIVYNDMIGFLYKNEVKNMIAEQVADMQMGTKYYVRVDMSELVVTITGPGVKLRADLKPGVAYAPCFSCGCSANRLQIRPLNDFNENETQYVR